MSIIEPDVLELLKHADNRYTLVVEAAKRGRELVAGATPLIMDAEDEALFIELDTWFSEHLPYPDLAVRKRQVKRAPGVLR